MKSATDAFEDAEIAREEDGPIAVTEIRKIIAELDRARANGTVYTYGNIQSRLRNALFQIEKSPASTTAADAWDEGFNTPSDGPLYDIGLRAQNPYRVAAPEGDGGNEG